MFRYPKKAIESVKHALLLLKVQAYKTIQLSVDEIRVLRRTSMQAFQYIERGQGLVEYALILVLVAIVVVAVLMILGPRIGNVFSSINKSLSGI
jgi:pilus assembly protein Flp/PilA